MAKKKTTESVEEAVQETPQFPTPEEPVQAEASETPVQEESAPEVKNDTAPAPAPVAEMPAEVLAYFQNNPDKYAVYFDKCGGMYTVSTPKAFLKDAILYRNPNNK